MSFTIETAIEHVNRVSEVAVKQITGQAIVEGTAKPTPGSEQDNMLFTTIGYMQGVLAVLRAMELPEDKVKQIFTEALEIVYEAEVQSCH